MSLFTNFSPTEIAFDDGLGLIRLKALAPSKWQLLEPFSYTTLAGATITVPKDFITDGTSSPLRIVITTWGGHYSSGALVHDYLYDCLNRGAPDPAAPARVDADNILYEAMGRAKPPVNFWVRRAIWLAVRIGGGPALKGLGVRNG